MTMEALLAHPAVQALGKALLHFLWQGALLATVLWIAKVILPQSAARLRYAAACLVMLAMPLTLLVTASLDLSRGNTVHEAAATRDSTTQWPPDSVPQLVFDAPSSSGAQAGIPGWAVCFWMLGVALLSLRAAGGWMRAQRLCRETFPAGAELQDLLRRLQARLRISAIVRLGMSARVEVPMVVGWFRPFVLLPVTALTGLSDAQIVAILAHELAHIRRYDYLVNLAQTAIETVLFYHPAVWWVGKQMRVEREHCCDDIAVGVCGSAFEYAGALAGLEEIRARVPEPALAATGGGDLLGRIRRLLGQPDRTSRPLGTLGAATAVVLVAGAIALRATPQQAPPTFDVASIKRDLSSEPGPQYRLFPGVTAQRATLKDLIMMAYFVHDFQVSGGPGWVTADRYNIEAKSEGTTAFSQDYRTLQLRRLQALLRDRFKLELHRETRELPIYELKVAKSGFKLPPLKEGSCIATDPKNPFPPAAGNPMEYCGFGGFVGRGRYQASTGSMADLAGALALPLGRTVVDKTGIAGRFRIEMTFAPDLTTPDAGPDIFTALQDQLGLRLEAAKGPVEVLVIDHAEKPSEN